MTTLVTTLEKAEHLTHDEFAERWTQEHSPIAEELPGLQRYVTVVPDDPEEASYDGIAILTFESREALEAAFDSPVGQRADEDVARFTEAKHRTIGDEIVHVG